jgi:hypothetical protein
VANRTRAWVTSARPGAARVAPNAPHGTDGDPHYEKGRTSGPERFWSTTRVRIALAAGLTVSLGLHIAFSPWTLLPTPAGIQFNDVADELAIPVDLIGEEPAQATPTPPEQTPPTQVDPEGEGAGRDAGPKPKPDAGPKDAGPRDANGSDDAAIASDKQDAALVALADLDAATADLTGPDGGAAVALGGDAGPAVPGVNGPRDPAQMLGMSTIVTAGQVNVTLLVNSAVIKEHPVGSRIEPIIEGIPQWQQFMQGADGKVDLLRDTDWILIFGPSLIHTDRDAIFVHYHVPDAVVDTTMDRVSKANTRGGSFDAGVSGVHAGRMFADNGDRVMMRVQHGVLLVVPPDKANEFARV